MKDILTLSPHDQKVLEDLAPGEIGESLKGYLRALLDFASASMAGEIYTLENIPENCDLAMRIRAKREGWDIPSKEAQGVYENLFDSEGPLELDLGDIAGYFYEMLME